MPVRCRSKISWLGVLLAALLLGSLRPARAASETTAPAPGAAPTSTAPAPGAVPGSTAPAPHAAPTSTPPPAEPRADAEPAPSDGPAEAGQADPCMVDEACGKLVDQARNLSKANLYEAALVEYQNAYSRTRSPGLLLNIGRIQQRLNQYESAIKTYHKYLQSDDTNPENRTKAQNYLQESEKALAELRRQNFPQLPSAHEKPPIYKRWWFWTLVGGAAVGAALGIGFGVAARDPDASGLTIYRPFEN